jgi:hypothetical protein
VWRLGGKWGLVGGGWHSAVGWGLVGVWQGGVLQRTAFQHALPGTRTAGGAREPGPGPGCTGQWQWWPLHKLLPSILPSILLSKSPMG